LDFRVGGLFSRANRGFGRNGGIASSLFQAVGETGFVLAVCIFAAAILISVNARRALLVVLFVGSLAVSASAVQAVLWPGQVILRASLEVLYRVITFGSAFYLLASIRGKWRIGPISLALSLMALHLDWVRWRGIQCLGPICSLI